MGKKNKGATNVQSEDTLPLRGKAPPDGGYDDEKYETFENGSYLKSRVALAIFAILTLVIGVVFFIFGIVVLVAHHITLRDLEFLIDFTYFRICVIIILVLGIIFIVVSIVGLVGTIKFGKFLLNAYAVGLGFVSVILIVGGALLIVFRGQFASDSLRFDYLRNAIVTQYRVDVEIDKNNRFVTNTIDYIQENYECCGAYGNVTSEYSWAIYKTKSLWYTSKNDKFPMVPESCCVRGGSLPDCQGRHGSDGPPFYGPAKNCMEPYRYVNDDLHKTGCYDTMKANMEFYTMIVGIALMALPLLLVLLSSCCACRVLRNSH